MSLRHLTITLLSASMAFAAPSRTLNARQALSSGAAAVNDNIQGWQDNIANVNGFLNMFANGTETSQAVASAAAFLVVDKPGTAANEPDRLMALSGLIDPSNTTAVGAATDLMSIFGGVLGNLSIIVDNPNDLDVQTSAVEAINCLRCNFVLPDIDDVYAGAVANNDGATSAATMGPLVCVNPTAGSFACTT